MKIAAGADQFVADACVQGVNPGDLEFGDQDFGEGTQGRLQFRKESIRAQGWFGRERNTTNFECGAGTYERGFLGTERRTQESIGKSFSNHRNVPWGFHQGLAPPHEDVRD